MQRVKLPTLEIPKALSRHNPCSGGEAWDCSAKISPGENFATFLYGEVFPAKASHGELPHTHCSRIKMCCTCVSLAFM